MAQPGHFTLRVLKAFQKNQGLLLSGALAYYLLLSVIPLFTFLLHCSRTWSKQRRCWLPCTVTLASSFPVI